MEQYEKRFREKQNKDNDVQDAVDAGWWGSERNENETDALLQRAEQDKNNLPEIKDIDINTTESGKELNTENIRTQICVDKDLQPENCADTYSYLYTVLHLDERAAFVDDQQNANQEENKSPLGKGDIQVYGK